MSVTIRLRRMGRNNLPFFRVVAADTRRSNHGRYIEALGWYDPGRDGAFSLKMDRVEYWMNQGAIVTDTVKNLIRQNRRQPGPSTPEQEPKAASAADEPAPAPAESGSDREQEAEGQAARPE